MQFSFAEEARQNVVCPGIGHEALFLLLASHDHELRAHISLVVDLMADSRCGHMGMFGEPAAAKDRSFSAGSDYDDVSLSNGMRDIFKQIPLDLVDTTRL